MTEDTITVTREHYERLKKSRVVFFGENSGEWTDEELEINAVQAAIQAAGGMIEDAKLTRVPVSEFSPDQFRAMLQCAAWAYMQVYVDYVPF